MRGFDGDMGPLEVPVTDRIRALGPLVAVGPGVDGPEADVTFGATFLSDPRSWFDSPSEQPCGEVEEVLVAAGGSYRCQGLSQDQARVLRQRYGSDDSGCPTTADFLFRRAPTSDFLPLGPSVTGVHI